MILIHFFLVFYWEVFNGSLQSFRLGGTITFTKKWRFGNFKIQNGGFMIAVFLQIFFFQVFEINYCLEVLLCTY